MEQDNFYCALTYFYMVRLRYENALYTVLYTVLFLSVGKLFLHKNKIFTK
jgi:hypothetical protein